MRVESLVGMKVVSSAVKTVAKLVSTMDDSMAVSTAGMKVDC